MIAARCAAKEESGEGGIRTRDTTFGSYNGLANRRLQPLGHLSGGECFGELKSSRGARGKQTGFSLYSPAHDRPAQSARIRGPGRAFADTRRGRPGILAPGLPRRKRQTQGRDGRAQGCPQGPEAGGGGEAECGEDGARGRV